jgi:hypothetical protein
VTFSINIFEFPSDIILCLYNTILYAVVFRHCRLDIFFFAVDGFEARSLAVLMSDAVDVRKKSSLWECVCTRARIGEGCSCAAPTHESLAMQWTSSWCVASVSHHSLSLSPPAFWFGTCSGTNRSGICVFGGFRDGRVALAVVSNGKPDFGLSFRNFWWLSSLLLLRKDGVAAEALAFESF